MSETLLDFSLLGVSFTVMLYLLYTMLFPERF